MAIYDGGFSGRPITLRLEVNQGAQSIEGNWSQVSWSLIAIKTGNTTAWNSNPAYWYVNINGAVWSGSWTYDFTSVGIGGSIFIASATTTYSHNADGTMTLSTYADASDPSGYLGFASAGGSLSLTTIPRATIGTWAVPGNAIAGVAKTLNLPRASASFTHTVHYSVGSTGWVLVGTGLGTSVSINVPLSTLSQIPNSTTGPGIIRVTTYNGATWIGAMDSSFILEAPASVVPDFTTVTNVEAVAGVAANIGGYVQGISKLNLAITGAAGIHGSTITAYKIEVAGQTINAVSGQTPTPLATSGTVPIVATITDSRGRTKQKTVNITVLAYAPPVITAITGQRALAGGTPDDEGTNIRVNINAAVQSLIVSTQRNALVYKVYSRIRGSGTWTLKTTQTPGGITFNSYYLATSYAIEDAWEFRVEVIDDFATSAIEFTIATAAIFQHWDGALGMGVGKYRQDGMLDVLGAIYQDDGRRVLGVEPADQVNGAMPLFDGTNWQAMLVKAPRIFASAAARDVVYPSPTQGIRVFRSDKQWVEQYFALYNSGSNPVGASSAGWYPIEGALPFGNVIRSTNAGNISHAAYTDLSANTFWDARRLVNMAAYNDGWAVGLAGRYRVHANVTAFGGSGLFAGFMVSTGATPTLPYALRGRDGSGHVQNYCEANPIVDDNFAVGDYFKLWALSALALGAWSATGNASAFTLEYVGPPLGP